MRRLRPNLDALWRRSAGLDVYGKPRLGLPVRVRVGLVALADTAARTSVRTDSSASRGRGEEPDRQATVLFPAEREPHPGDVVEAMNLVFSVASVQPRLSLSGAVAHWEVTLVARLP